MLTFLGVLDTAYFAQNGLFHLAHDGAANAFVVAAVLALAAALVGYVAIRDGDRTPSTSAPC